MYETGGSHGTHESTVHYKACYPVRAHSALLLNYACLELFA